jgi:hypothetical protein
MHNSLQYSTGYDTAAFLPGRGWLPCVQRSETTSRKHENHHLTLQDVDLLRNPQISYPSNEIEFFGSL